MKRHLFKFLLSLIRALVIMKRLVVWLIQSIGRFFAWVFRPVVLYAGVPLYKIVRRYMRRYEEISENPWERRRAVLLSQPALVIGLGALIFISTHLAVAASSQPGVVAGSDSILLTKLVTNRASDWHVDGDVGSDGTGEALDQELPQVTYRDGGAVAYVFPYSGSVGRAPVAEPEPDTTQPKKQDPIQKYAVQRGDTLARIAQKFSLKTETLMWANNITTATAIRPGDTLVVPAVDGVVYSVKNGGTPNDVAKVFKVAAKTIADANNISTNTRLKAGQSVLVPGARPIAGVTTPPPKTVAVNQPSPAPRITPPAEPQPEPVQNDVPDDVTPEPTPSPVVVEPAPSSGAGMIWPTSHHSVTQYFSAGHPGLDIDGDYTDPVYAADSGTVIFSGWNNGGYGNMILIDHGNGIQTRYGHSSRVFVHLGQQVNKGDVISMIGTTGRSTGTHLHFEIIVKGVHVNPFKYVR